MNLISMFFLFVYFGLLCLSGGSSLLQFYIDELVTARGWLTLEELGNFMAVSQATPGPIGVNLATFLGYRRGGLPGGFLCTVGLLLPSLFLMTLAVKSYGKWHESRFVRGLMFGLKPMTAALVISALFACFGMSILSDPVPFEILGGGVSAKDAAIPEIRWEMLPVLGFSILALSRWKWSIMSVIFLSAGGGALLYAAAEMLF